MLTSGLDFQHVVSYQCSIVRTVDLNAPLLNQVRETDGRTDERIVVMLNPPFPWWGHKYSVVQNPAVYLYTNIRTTTYRFWFAEWCSRKDIRCDHSKQKNCFIAKMTARCALHRGAMKDFDSLTTPMDNFPKLFWCAFVLIDSMNVHRKFEMHSLSRSWNNSDWSFGWGLWTLI